MAPNNSPYIWVSSSNTTVWYNYSSITISSGQVSYSPTVSRDFPIWDD